MFYAMSAPCCCPLSAGKLSANDQVLIREKSYQPVSRILFRVAAAVIIYLAPALLQESSCLPSGARPSRSASGEPPSVAGIRGISACKVYPPRQLLAGAVGSYPTFSPSSVSDGQLFSVALSIDAYAPPGR